MTTEVSPTDTTDRRRLLTEKDVADIFTVSTRTVRRWASAGELTAIRIGGVTRYREDEVLSVIGPQNDERRPGRTGRRSQSSPSGGATHGSYSP